MNGETDCFYSAVLAKDFRYFQGTNVCLQLDWDISPLDRLITALSWKMQNFLIQDNLYSFCSTDDFD